jgi:hypothetical protein
MRKSIQGVGAVLMAVFASVSSTDVRADGMRRGADESSLTVERGVASVTVTLNFAKILKFDQPARTIVIGNAGILDGTLSDEHTIVLTGKSAGTTNLIVLGEAGSEITHLTVHVAPPARGLTAVFSGTVRQTYSCVGGCWPVLSVGDDPQHFGATQGQIQSRQTFTAGGAGAQP